MLVSPPPIAPALDAETLQRASLGDARRGWILDVHAEGAAPARTQAESFIQSIFGSRYGAQIRHWAPSLVTLRKHSTFVAAAGYRRASDPLFLEHYLPTRVEASIAARAGVTAARNEIFEVAHFASAHAGAGRALMMALGHHLVRHGCTWVVCTATRELRLLFARMGVHPLELGSAHESRLGPEAACWGTYYDHSPVVLASRLERSLAALDRRA